MAGVEFATLVPQLHFGMREKARVITSLRHDRDGLRFSPHFYNTAAELDRAVEVLKAAL